MRRIKPNRIYERWVHRKRGFKERKKGKGGEWKPTIKKEIYNNI